MPHPSAPEEPPGGSDRTIGPTLRNCRAVILDTDGVLLDSAPAHAAAWKAAFDACLRDRTRDGSVRPFDQRADYLAFVDGKPRLDGAASFLAARGIRLPEGKPDDLPGTESVRAVAAWKDRLFTAWIADHGVQTWPGTVRLLHALRREGMPRVAVSASRHAGELLDAAGLAPLLDDIVDGREAARLGLPGKPDPALFLAGAERLGVPPADAAVVEDARAGVEAGRRGGFAPVIGVARGSPAEGTALREHGAEVVVSDLGELLVGVDASRTEG